MNRLDSIGRFNYPQSVVCWSAFLYFEADMHDDEQPTYEDLTQDTIPLQISRNGASGCIAGPPFYRLPYPAVVNRGQRSQQVPGAGLIGDVTAMIMRASSVIARSRQGRIRAASRGETRRVERYIRAWEKNDYGC